MKITLKTKIATFFLASFLFTIHTFSYAQQIRQQARRQVLSFGPKIGVNLSDFNGDVTNNNIQLGLTAGAMLTYSVINTFGVSVEALYSQRGAKIEGTGVDYNRRLNYIEVPILARYFLNKNGDFRPNLFIGPDFGFKLNAKDANRSTAPDKVDISDAINPVDVGLTGGIGLNFSVIEKVRFLFDARYTYGLSDVSDKVLANFTNNGKVSNSTITFTMGVSFGIGKKYQK